MLNIPESIKNLLKRDGVLKNFRVSFPNGERGDITNDQIVKESMRFEEILSSRTQVKFGLCEANLLSFRCYGVENIKHKVINVRMEIDISSLSAEEIAQYGQTSSDVPFPFYPISYGSFLVTSCERDANINLREVIAASVGLMENESFTASMDDASEYDKKKWFYFTYSASKTASFDKTLYTVLQGQSIFDPDYVGHEPAIDIPNTVQDSVVFGSELTSMYSIRGANGWFDLSLEINISVRNQTIGYVTDDPFAIEEIGMIKMPNGYKERARAFLQSCLDAIAEVGDLNTLQRHGGGILKNDGLTDLKNLLYNSMCSCLYLAFWDASDRKHNPQTTDPSYERWFDNDPYVPMDSYFAMSGESLIIPLSMTVKMRKINGAVVGDYVFNGSFSKGADPYKLLEFTSESATFINHDIVDITTSKINIGNTTRYSPEAYISSINVRTNLQDFLELNGLFGGIGRDGFFRTYNLLKDELFPSENLYPADNLYGGSEENDARLNRSEYISCAYDEDYFYYKGIVCEYTNTSDEDAEYRVLFRADDDNPDMPYYDISNNSIIVNGKFTEEQIIAMIQPLVDILMVFRYYMVDLNMRALPYIEIGDIVYLRTPEKQVDFPILSQTISGIQDLRANATSR